MNTPRFLFFKLNVGFQVLLITLPWLHSEYATFSIFCPFLPIFLYTDENSNASAFDKQLHTLLKDFISEKFFLQKLFCCLLHAEVL